MEKDDKQGKKQKSAGGSMVVGLSLGVAFGIIFGNLPVWMCLGIGLGLFAPSFLKKKDNDTDDGKDDADADD